MVSQMTVPSLFIIFVILGFSGSGTRAQNDSNIIGAILNLNSRMGKEVKVSLEIAIETVNNASNNNRSMFMLQVINSSGRTLVASRAADELTKNGTQVGAIVGMETWSEAASVAEIANEAQVPILSFAAPAITPPSLQLPFLVRMAAAGNDNSQMQCVASIVSSYGWRRVIGIYEDNGYNTDLGFLTLLSDALVAVGAEIEHWLAFPSSSTHTDPRSFIREKFTDLNDKQSRVFIVVRSSIETATDILTVASHIGLMGRDSVWIATEPVSSLLDSLNSTLLSSMKGLIGIKTYFSKTNPSLKDFSGNFSNLFRANYPDENRTEPGFYALLACDTISTAVSAIEKSNNASRALLLENILSSNFDGLSGKIRFQYGELSRAITYEIVNVVGETYVRLKFWSRVSGFSDDETEGKSKEGEGGSGEQVLGGEVYWPGKLERLPLGWVMPSEAHPLIIGIPAVPTFEKFVDVKDGGEPTGFSIDVFKEVIKLLNYHLPHKFVTCNGTYDELVDQVYFKKFDAVVGDITILANRSNHVEFTQPYIESSLTMLVPVKPYNKTWLLVKPFSTKLWLVVSIVFMYIVFIVWSLERSNPEFSGSWRTQIGTAMWFTCLTQRESVHNNFTRFVMYVWLFTIFVIASSYTASLTSMVSIKRLEPILKDVNTVKESNSKVGCSLNSFTMRYLEEVLKFKSSQILQIASEYDYLKALENGTIKAAFIELPYERLLLSRNSIDYQDAGIKYRLGGFGFVFPKGSPMVGDFSKAILNLSEEGILHKVEQSWFTSYSPSSSNTEERIGLDNFKVLFLVTSITSTMMLAIYLCKRWVSSGDDLTSSSDGQVMITINESSLCDNCSNNPEQTLTGEIQMEPIVDSNNQARILRTVQSFPTLGGHIHRFDRRAHERLCIPTNT